MNQYEITVRNFIALVGEIYQDIPYGDISRMCREHFDKAYVAVRKEIMDAEKQEQKSQENNRA